MTEAPEMRPTGNPFYDLCTMLGLMIVVWGWAEHTLAMTIDIIAEHVGPLKGHPEVPRSQKQRVACFRVALRDVEALKPLQQEGRALAVRFVELGRRRNKFVHGATGEGNKGQFEAFRFETIEGKHAAQHHRFDQSDTVSLNAEIFKLSEDAVAFMQKTAALLSG
jgi:hypothetical protein